VRFAFSEEQEELRRSVRRVLEAHGGVAAARRVLGSELGHDAALWSALGVDLGLAGLAIPETLGGAGLGAVEIAAVLEELGGTLAPVPLWSTVCLGAAALVAYGDTRHLPAIARGERTATVARGGAITARGDLLSGQVRPVVDGHTADLLIVVAGDTAYLVSADGRGVHRRRLPTLDATRPLAEITLEDAPATPLGDAARLAPVLARAAIALAAEQVGGAQRCLDLSVAYAQVRHQFGRPIGSFQAIQHTLAEMFLLVESARSAAYGAAWAADQDDAELPLAAATAAAFAGDAFFRCAGDTIQVHGGIGFTWEHDAHLYFKRARASRGLLATPDQHRARVADAILGSL
jgi:alkylation response protein AidB-like acyl-CoA dehydrogenase